MSRRVNKKKKNISSKNSSLKNTKNTSKKATISVINEKLDQILAKQGTISHEESILEHEEEKIEQEEKNIEKEERKLESIERQNQSLEQQELAEIHKLEQIEKQIEQNVEPHPLRKITLQDLARGAVGSLFGAVAHYTFIYGLKAAEHIDLLRASVLYVISFVIGGVFLYFTGFRKIKDPKVLSFLPIRLMVLYSTAVVTSIAVLAFFTPEFGTSFAESYKAVATVSLTAMIGAATADLIGKE